MCDARTIRETKNQATNGATLTRIREKKLRSRVFRLHQSGLKIIRKSSRAAFSARESFVKFSLTRGADDLNIGGGSCLTTCFSTHGRCSARRVCANKGLHNPSHTIEATRACDAARTREKVCVRVAARRTRRSAFIRETTERESRIPRTIIIGPSFDREGSNPSTRIIHRPVDSRSVGRRRRKCSLHLRL